MPPLVFTSFFGFALLDGADDGVSKKRPAKIAATMPKPMNTDVAGNRKFVPKASTRLPIEKPNIVLAMAAPLAMRLNSRFASLAVKAEPVNIQNWIIITVPITSNQM